MRRTLTLLAIALVAVITWQRRNSAGFGEWLRRLSDVPTNAVLLGTAEFEREGRDPAKSR